MADYQIQPWGEEVLLFMIAQLSSQVANMFRGKKDKARQPADFIPGLGRRSEQQSTEEIQAVLRASVSSMGARKGRRKK